VKVNDNLRNDPHVVNEDPYNAGWLVEIRPKNSLALEKELKSLLGAREYNEWIDKLEDRSKE
jgi:glycine cleavage system H protein